VCQRGDPLHPGGRPHLPRGYLRKMEEELKRVDELEFPWHRGVSITTGVDRVFGRVVITVTTRDGIIPPLLGTFLEREKRPSLWAIRYRVEPEPESGIFVAR
jgi:hypothetical protein